MLRKISCINELLNMYIENNENRSSPLGQIVDNMLPVPPRGRVTADSSRRERHRRERPHEEEEE